MKKQEILDGDWENLIILDACRYDIFKEMYDDFFRGKLEPRLSRGSTTGEWLYKTFTRKLEDVVYFSATPHINSKGIPINEVNPRWGEFEWNAVDYFSKIIDIWNWGWNDKFGVVLPKEVTKTVIKYNENNRKIIHYNQPHRPFITKFNPKNYFNKKNKKLSKNNNSNNSEMFFAKFRKAVVRNWPLKYILKYYLYKRNLKIVLKEVVKLIKNVEGKSIITADHGEAFGEMNNWGHRLKLKNPVLRVVPWFEVKDVKFK